MEVNTTNYYIMRRVDDGMKTMNTVYSNVFTALGTAVDCIINESTNEEKFNIVKTDKGYIVSTLDNAHVYFVMPFYTTGE